MYNFYRSVFPNKIYLLTKNNKQMKKHFLALLLILAFIFNINAQDKGVPDQSMLLFAPHNNNALRNNPEPPKIGRAHV